MVMSNIWADRVNNELKDWLHNVVEYYDFHIAIVKAKGDCPEHLLPWGIRLSMALEEEFYSLPVLRRNSLTNSISDKINKHMFL